MAITYFNSTAVPADNGTNATTTITITPPGSMQTGDLVILIAFRRNATATIAITTTGGQTWNEHQVHQSSTAVLTAGLFWCRYNGTWSADPVVTFNAGINTSVAMHVFRPTSSTKEWAVEYDFAPGWVSYSGNVTQTIGQSATTHNDVVALGILGSDDDNTWGSQTATWLIAGSAQYRNTAGSDSSHVTMYKIFTTTQTATTPSITQLTLGADPGEKIGIGFYEADPPDFTPQDPFGIMGIFGI